MYIHKEGNKIIDFEIITSQGSLNPKNLLGTKYVLYFYPKDDTPGCTQEAKDFNDHLAEFKKLNCRIIGVSKDNLSSHDKFQEKYCLNIELATDPTGEIFKNLDLWQEKSMYGKKYLGIARTTFLIDQHGIILKIWQNVKVTGHIKEVLDTVKEFS